MTYFVPFEIPVIATILGWYDGCHKEIFACVYLHLGAPMSPRPLWGGGQLHPHFPSIEIAIPQAEHLWFLLFFGFAEPGPVLLFFGFGPLGR